jgi:hypothetical protein
MLQRDDVAGNGPLPRGRLRRDQNGFACVSVPLLLREAGLSLSASAARDASTPISL